MKTIKRNKQSQMVSDNEGIESAIARLMYLCQIKYHMDPNDLRCVKAYLDYLRYAYTKDKK